MELKDLVGKHILSGVDFDSEQVSRWEGDEKLENAQVMRFMLDGVVYAAVEDHSDGYRSMMSEIKTNSNYEIKNAFHGVEVLGIHREERGYQKCDILELVSTKTGKTVIEVGTDNSEDYYPSFVSNFRAENI